MRNSAKKDVICQNSVAMAIEYDGMGRGNYPLICPSFKKLLKRSSRRITEKFVFHWYWLDKKICKTAGDKTHTFFVEFKVLNPRQIIRWSFQYFIVTRSEMQVFMFWLRFLTPSSIGESKFHCTFLRSFFITMLNRPSKKSVKVN